ARAPFFCAIRCFAFTASRCPAHVSKRFRQDKSPAWITFSQGWKGRAGIRWRRGHIRVNKPLPERTRMASCPHGQPMLAYELSNPVSGRRRRGGRPRFLSWRRVDGAAMAAVELPIAALTALVLAVSVMVAPDSTIRTLDLDLPSILICPFYAATDIPCLFCGMTRSFMAMGGLDLGQAFVFHPLGPALWAGAIAVEGAALASLVTGRRIGFRIGRARRRMIIRYGAVILVASWLVKVVIWRRTGLL
ncbi:MAG: DUF2752 domain-containing protein, partial [Pseudomonadota bacterium]